MRDPEDRFAFAEMLSAVNATLERTELSAVQIGVYWDALVDYDLPAIREALRRCLRNPDTGQFMPKPADIVRMIEGSTRDRAFAAWAKVERAMRTVGGYQSVVFDDPIAMAVIDRMGGWPRLCETLVDDLPFRSREFEHAYRGIVARNEVPEYPPHLVGRHEIENRRVAGWEPRLVFVGNPEQCRRVLDGGARAPEQLTFDVPLPVVAPRVQPKEAEAHERREAEAR